MITLIKTGTGSVNGLFNQILFESDSYDIMLENTKIGQLLFNKTNNNVGGIRIYKPFRNKGYMSQTYNELKTIYGEFGPSKFCLNKKTIDYWTKRGYTVNTSEYDLLQSLGHDVELLPDPEN